MNLDKLNKIIFEIINGNDKAIPEINFDLNKKYIKEIEKLIAEKVAEKILNHVHG